MFLLYFFPNDDCKIAVSRFTRHRFLRQLSETMSFRRTQRIQLFCLFLIGFSHSLYIKQTRLSCIAVTYYGGFYLHKNNLQDSSSFSQCGRLREKDEASKSRQVETKANIASAKEYWIGVVEQTCANIIDMPTRYLRKYRRKENSPCKRIFVCVN